MNQATATEDRGAGESMQTIESVTKVKAATMSDATTYTPKTRLDWALHHGAAGHEMVLLETHLMKPEGRTEKSPS